MLFLSLPFSPFPSPSLSPPLSPPLSPLPLSSSLSPPLPLSSLSPPLSLFPVESISEEGNQFYNKIWFILLCTVAVVLLLVIVATLAAILRWRSKNKGNMYTG